MVLESKEERNERARLFRSTPEGKKAYRINNWKRRGVRGDLNTLYDKKYIIATHCECCLNEFKSDKDRCMDHSHKSGNFRQILCNSCNSHDFWMKVLIPDLI